MSNNNCGSVQNYLATNTKNADPTPEIGMGVTEISYTDRRPYTVVAILSDRKIQVQTDKAIRQDKLGMSDCQDYTYEQDPNGGVYTLVLKRSKKNPAGRWVGEGQSINSNRFRLGYRNKYHDYSF